MTNRRAFLSVIGGSAILAAAGGSLWAFTRDPVGARRPWSTAGSGEGGAAEPDPRRRFLSYAILAPSPHNRQPWLVDLAVPDEITLYCQADRRLPQTDPFDRQITIGLGCFLELLALAAAEEGFRVEMSLFPQGEPQPRLDGRPVAQVRLSRDPTIARDDLFAQVLARRSNKQPYDLTRPVGRDLLAAVGGAARVGKVASTDDPERVAALRARTWEAFFLEITTGDTARESVDLIRIGRTEIEANPDGIDLSGPMVEALSLTGLLSREDMLDRESETFRQQLPILKAPFDTAMAFLWLTTAGNGRSDQIAAGRDYVRLNLAATALGIAMHPLSQALQEFEAMNPHRAALRGLLGVPEGETLQMLVRLGYGPALEGSPRWPLQTRIRSA